MECFVVHSIIWPSDAKPVIARKDEGKDQIIKNGEIYYRYGGRTQKIQSAELESIINHRIEQNNQSWLNLMAKIAALVRKTLRYWIPSGV
ncbi:hypothetical protein CF392_16350 [Tamilnaduibacter salinus]|uniref:Uncharacterized protein n=1 Tax=Tamilnaduibacter salinus TaxID=1484056 RepID=A0A2A2HYX4_9GAMM|nr:hypothetical protein CF392_16350 [Tamilnaduibacter salinus]